MKIIKVTGGYVPAEQQGGTAVVAHALSRALQSIGNETIVFTTNANGKDELPIYDEWKNVDGVTVFYGERQLPFLPVFSPSMISEFKKNIKGADLVLLAGVWVWYAPAITKICKQRGIPVYLYTHGVRSDERMRSQSFLKKTAWWWLKDRKMFNDVTGIVAITEDEKKELLELGTTQNIVVIPNGVEIPAFEENAREILETDVGIAHNEDFIFFLGRTEPIKGVDLLIKSFASYLKQSGSKNKLVVSGPDRNNHRAELESLARELGIFEQVVFTGPVKGKVKSALFQECSGFALLSITEVLAMSALEAMKYGKPVVVTDAQAFAEFVDRDMMITTDRNPEQVAHIFSDMLNKSPKMIEMASRGKNCVDAEYSWVAIAEKTIRKLT